MTSSTPADAERSFDTILLSRTDDGVVLCTFNRPEKRNALNSDMVREIDFALAALADDPDIRVLVFTGAGERSFVSGADIAELRQRRSVDAQRRINTGLFHRIESFPHPTIAAVRGFALGGGCELALACDLRICGQGATFGQPEVTLGIVPGAGGTYRLPRLIGLGRARELIFTGRLVEADEALAVGLVNRVVPDEQVVDEALAMAKAIAKNSKVALRYAKVLLNHQHEVSTAAAIALEATAQAVLFEDHEKDRRMGEFLERRNRKKTS